MILFIVFVYDQDEYKRFLGVCATREIAEQVITDNIEEYEGLREREEYEILKAGLVEK